MNVLFDLDDTIHDKAASLKTCAGRLFEEFGLEAQCDRIEFIQYFVAENVIIQPKTKVFEALALTFSFELSVYHRMLKRFDESFHIDAQAFVGAIEALELIKASGASLACVTNGRDFFQRNKISVLGCDALFDVVVTSGAFGIKKPDLSIFKEALQQLNSTPAECAYCGDNLRADIEPARALGMVTIWKSLEVLKPDCVDYQFDKFVDFPSIWRAET
jgi:HAD superfamily hydrolase (TIGR01549 family)